MGARGAVSVAVGGMSSGSRRTVGGEEGMAVRRQAGGCGRGCRDERGDESDRMHLVDWFGLMRL